MITRRRALVLVTAAACSSAAAPAARAPMGNRAGTPPKEGVHAIDWQNRAYDLDSLGYPDQRVTVRDGQAALHFDENKNLVGHDTGDDGFLAIGAPRFGDVDGDGIDDAVMLAYLNPAMSGGVSVVWVWSVRMEGTLDHPLALTTGVGHEDEIADVTLDGATIVIVREDHDSATGYRAERWAWRDRQLREDVAARRPVPAPAK